MNLPYIFKSIYVLWYRELLHYWRDPVRVVASIMMPVGFLIFGSGLSSIVGKFASEVVGPQANLIQFLFPGVLGLSIFFVAIFSGASVIWDREFGFLKEILVAPISRAVVALGRIAGGATIAMIQSSILLAIAPFIGLHLSFLIFIKLWFLMLLISLALTAFGVLIGSLVRTTEAHQMISYSLIAPMALLSGAYFPLKNLPFWMDFLVRFNPFTYAVDALRQTILNFSQITVGVNIFGKPIIFLGIFGDVLIVFVFGIIMTELAIWAFSRLD
ncbi:MAG: ABC transporter permease [bacterium]|nr:ABC transporter permease [bacterium]